MVDKDRVFAGFKDDKTAHSDRRETLTIPRRAGAPGSSAVEVVHERSGGAAKDRPQRQGPNVRAASWDGGFPTKQAVRTLTPIGPLAAKVVSGATRPLMVGPDDQLLLVVAQHHGMSSSMRLLGQPLTRRVLVVDQPQLDQRPRHGLARRSRQALRGTASPSLRWLAWLRITRWVSDSVVIVGLRFRARLSGCYQAEPHGSGQRGSTQFFVPLTIRSEAQRSQAKVSIILLPSRPVAQIGIGGFDGQIEIEARRLQQLPEAAPALLYGMPALPAGQQEFAAEASRDLSSLVPSSSKPARRPRQRRTAGRFHPCNAGLRDPPH